MLPKLLDFIFPRICIGCGEWGFNLCPQCLNKIKANNKKISAPYFEGMTAILAYSGLVEKIIKKIKFEFYFDQYHELVELAATFLGENKDFTKIYSQNLVLVPVPLHPARLRWRGFNQSEMLAKSLAEKLKLPFIPDLLIRTKNTQTQSLLKKKDRLTNIKNAFSINSKHKVKNIKYLIFDDIWTTGSTMRECVKILKQNGAGFVWGITLAA